MSCNNPFCGVGCLCIFFGIIYYFMLYINIPAYYESNPLEKEEPSDKYYYFNNLSASEECNEKKEDILIDGKTLSELFPNPNTIILLGKAIEWITLIICIYLFFMLSVRNINRFAHKILLYFEIGVGVLLLIFWIILIFKKSGLEHYKDFLNCENINKDKIKTIPGVDKLYDVCMFIILYLFYIGLYFGSIVARYYVFKKDEDYHLI